MSAPLHRLGALLATWPLLGCGPGDPAAEARADSAAAGYEVGVAPAAATPPDSAAAVTPDAPGSRPLVRPVPPALPPRVDAARTDSPRPVAAAPGTVTKAPAGTPLTNPSVTSPGGPPSGVPVPLPDTIVVAGRVKLSEQLEFDAAERTAWLRLVHAESEANDGLNIAGRSRGALTIVVPLGWRVEAATLNRDAERPHSAVVIEGEPHPGDTLTPAFSGARTQRAGGIVQGETGTLAFTAERVGRYAIACGVAGHAEGGEWIRLLVERAAKPAQR